MTSKKNNLDAPSELGDPSAVSLHVADIHAILQVHGSFTYTPKVNDTPDLRRLLPNLAVVEAEAFVGDDDHLVVMIEFRFDGQATHADDTSPSDVPGDEATIVEVAARFAISYRLDTDKEFAEKDLKAFAFINGQFNAWPYWREYLHTTLNRAGLPAFVLPPFSPGRIAQQLKPQASESASTADDE